MVIHELTSAECRDVIARAHHGRLGCAHADQPYVVPFSFHFDPEEDCLYSFSTRGQKIDWMRSNPKVCVEVDEIVDSVNWISVVVFGRYEETRDSKQDAAVRRRAHELFQQHAKWWLPGLGKLTPGEEHYTPVVYRILIDKLTGRRAGQSARSRP